MLVVTIRQAPYGGVLAQEFYDDELEAWRSRKRAAKAARDMNADWDVETRHVEGGAKRVDHYRGGELVV